MNSIYTLMPWGNIDRVEKAGREFALPSLINGESGEVKEKEFSSYLTTKLDKVNELIHDSESKVESFLIDPDSVDPHDVTLALAKANMSVNMTKQVVDSAIKAYQTIISLR